MTVAQLFAEAARRIGRDPRTCENFVRRVVEEHWLDSVEALRRLQPADWAVLQLPLALQNAIQEILNEKGASTSPPPSLDDVDTAADALQMTLADHDKETRIQSVGLAYKIVTEVLKNPDDITKRKVRTAAISKRIPHPKLADKIKQFLIAIGFLDQGEYIVLESPSEPVLKHALELLTVLAPVHGFDPYSPHISSTSTTSTAKVVTDPKLRAACGLPTVTPHEELERERKKIEKAINAKPVKLDDQDMKPVSIYHQDNRPQTHNEVDHNEYTDVTAGYTLNDLLRIKKNLTQGPQFQSKSKEELERLQRQNIYDKARIKLMMPGRWVVCYVLPATATTESLYECVKKVVKDELEFELYTTPPPTNVVSGKTTLRKAGLTPSAVLYIRFKTEVKQAIREDLITDDMRPPSPKVDEKRAALEAKRRAILEKLPKKDGMKLSNAH